MKIGSLIVVITVAFIVALPIALLNSPDKLSHLFGLVLIPSAIGAAGFLYIMWKEGVL